MIIEMVVKRLLEIHTMAKVVSKRARVTNHFDGSLNVQAASIPIDIDTEVVTNNGGNNGGNITVIDVDNLLPPTEKTKPDRFML